MARKSQIPRFYLHKPSGQAVVKLPRPDGKRKMHYLGPWGKAEVEERYRKLIAAWLRDHASPEEVLAKAKNVTIAQLVVPYLKFARKHYVKDGELTSEFGAIKSALRFLKGYAKTKAKDFGPRKLKAVQQAMIEAKFSRDVINKHIGRVRRMFKWAVADELVEVTVFQALQTVPGLQKGRTMARELPPVAPVADDKVAKTLPHLPRMVADMVRLQRATGMRPSEVCLLRPLDINREQSVWLYRPESHKTEHHGKLRVIPIGPKAQEILQPYLDRQQDAYCFNPPNSKRGRYTRDSYRRAVTRGCERARIKPWAPNQLRHTRATEIRKEHGLEAAQVVLGHSKADVTQVYAERDWELASKVAMQSG